MDEELISKKELLERFSISYGSLYRWKRMGLIPEDWFIKKATVTGQETFFPKQLICERVELIKTQKDDCSLNDLCKQINQASEKKAVLIIKTVFGEKSFHLSDIQSIAVDGGEREPVDITEEIFNHSKNKK